MCGSPLCHVGTLVPPEAPHTHFSVYCVFVDDASSLKLLGSRFGTVTFQRAATAIFS